MSAGEPKNGTPTKPYKVLQASSASDKTPSSKDLRNKVTFSDENFPRKQPFLKKRSGLFRFYKCLPSKSQPGTGRNERRRNTGPKINTGSAGNDTGRSSGNLKTQSLSVMHTPLTYDSSSGDITDSIPMSKSDKSLVNESVISPNTVPDNGTEKYSTTAKISSRFNLMTQSARASTKASPSPTKQRDLKKSFPGLGQLNQDYTPSEKSNASKFKGHMSMLKRNKPEPKCPTPTPRDAAAGQKRKDGPLKQEKVEASESRPNSMYRNAGSADVGKYDHTVNDIDRNECPVRLKSVRSPLVVDTVRQTTDRSQRSSDTRDYAFHQWCMEPKRPTSCPKSCEDVWLLPETQVKLLDSTDSSSDLLADFSSHRLHILQEHRFRKSGGDLNYIRSCSSRSNLKQEYISTLEHDLSRIAAELVDLQSAFVQRVDGLEEEMQVKNRRWCDSQIKMAEKVGTLFSDVDTIRQQLKTQQTHVKNFAENVDKEFKVLKAEVKTNHTAMEAKVKELQDNNYELLLQLEEVKTELKQQLSKPKMTIDTSISTEAFENLTSTTKSPEFQEDAKNEAREARFPSKRKLINAHNVLQKGPLFSNDPYGFVTAADAEELEVSKLEESVEPEIPESNTTSCNGAADLIASRTTYPNGDVEVIYTNGTRELTKKDKSEIRHIYRNGDIRMLSADGTVAYFYAQSSTWQTTFPTGIELFKFQNGIFERRFPNGFVEQTDADGRITLFQSKQPALTSTPASDVLSAQEAIPPPTGISFTAPGFAQGTVQPVRVLRPSTMENRAPLVRMAKNTRIQKQGVKLASGEHIVVFETGEEEIHGADYRKRIFPDGTVKTVYRDGSHETRYPNGRIRIKDGKGNLVTDVTVAPNVPPIAPPQFAYLPRGPQEANACKTPTHIQKRQQSDVS